MNPSHLLRAGPSGPSFEPSTPGYVLTIQADGKNVAPEPLVPSAINVERIDSGNGGGARLVDVDTALLLEGCLVSVASVGALFWLAKDAPASLHALVDGITIVQSDIDADDIWVRLKGPPNPIFAGTPPLFVDPTLGNDDNNGQASGASALKSLDEWSRRMDGQMLRTPFTVNCAAGDAGNFGPCRLGEDNQTGNVFVTVLGASARSVEIGTVTSFTAQNSATGQEFVFLDSSGVGPVIPDNSRLEIVGSTTPGNIGGTGYVKGFGAGGATNPYTTVWTTTNGIPFFPQAGDTYVVSTPATIVRSVQSQWLNPYSAHPGAGGVAWTNLLLSGERFAAYQITSNELIGNGNFSSAFVQCVFDDNLGSNFTRCNLRSYGCEYKQAVGVAYGSHNFHSPCFRQGLQVAQYGVSSIDSGPACFDGALSTLNIAVGGYVVNSTDVCFSRLGNAAQAAVLVQAAGHAQPVGLWWSPPQGARNAVRCGVVLFALGRINTNFFSIVNAIASSLFPVSVDGTTELVQFSAIENSGALVSETSLSTGGIVIQQDLLAGTHLGSVPAVSPTLGSERYTIGNGQFARSAGGALSTVVPASSLPSKTHAQLHSLQVASPTVQTVGAATAFLVQCNLANPGISGPIDGVTVYCEAVFVGYDGTEGVSVKVSRTFKRVAGVLTALGTLHVISPIDGDAALLGVTVALNVTGTSVQAQATGVAGATINWNAYLELRSTEFVG